jgi:hypothetical protein
MNLINKLINKMDANISVEEAKILIKKGAILIDVRTP